MATTTKAQETAYAKEAKTRKEDRQIALRRKSYRTHYLLFRMIPKNERRAAKG